MAAPRQPSLPQPDLVANSPLPFRSPTPPGAPSWRRRDGQPREGTAEAAPGWPGRAPFTPSGLRPSSAPAPPSPASLKALPGGPSVGSGAWRGFWGPAPRLPAWTPRRGVSRRGAGGAGSAGAGPARGRERDALPTDPAGRGLCSAGLTPARLARVQLRQNRPPLWAPWRELGNRGGRECPRRWQGGDFSGGFVGPTGAGAEGLGAPPSLRGLGLVGPARRRLGLPHRSPFPAQAPGGGIRQQRSPGMPCEPGVTARSAASISRRAPSAPPPTPPRPAVGASDCCPRVRWLSRSRPASARTDGERGCGGRVRWEIVSRSGGLWAAGGSGECLGAGRQAASLPSLPAGVPSSATPAGSGAAPRIGRRRRGRRTAASLSHPASLRPFLFFFSPAAPAVGGIRAELFVLRGKRSFPSRSRIFNAQRCGSEGQGPVLLETLARRGGGECNGAGGIRSAPGAPPGALLGRSEVAPEYKTTEAGLLYAVVHE